MLDILPDHIPLKLNLYNIQSLRLTEFPLKRIEKIVSNKESRIGKFKLLKKNSLEFREIEYPFGDYKKLLHQLHKRLQKRTQFLPTVCGGVIEKSLYDMVKSHCAKEAIYQVDLENFFPSISIEVITKFFINSGCSDKVSKLLANIVTLNGTLPQGYPTSPLIANLILWKLDIEQSNICKKYNLDRTRWIDDIIFSGQIIDLEKAIPSINTSFKYRKFKVKGKKISFVRRKDKKKKMEVVGLDIRKRKPDVPQTVFNKLEEILLALSVLTNQEVRELYKDEFKSKDIQQSLRGKISFVGEYNKNKEKHLLSLYKEVFE